MRQYSNGKFWILKPGAQPRSEPFRALLWAFTEAVRTPGGPHFKEKRESAFDQAMTALLDDFAKLTLTHGN